MCFFFCSVLLLLLAPTPIFSITDNQHIFIFPVWIYSLSPFWDASMAVTWIRGAPSQYPVYHFAMSPIVFKSFLSSWHTKMSCLIGVFFFPRTGSFWWETSFRDHHLEKPLLPGRARHFFFFLFSSWIYLTYRKVKVLVAQSCPTLCNPMDYISRQVPLSVGFFRQEYWSGLPCPFPGHLPDPGIETLRHFLHWQADSLPLTTWEAYLFPQALLMKTSELYTSLHFYHKYTICFLTTSPTNYTDSFFFFCQLCINIVWLFLSFTMKEADHLFMCLRAISSFLPSVCWTL